MATFSSKTFNSALYQSFRPVYNRNFFKMVYDYHAQGRGKFDLAVDVGTGTGQVAAILAEKFRHVKGVDASAKMLESAVQKPNVEYLVSPSEDLSAIASSSVDVLTVAQALHWFDHPRFFAEVNRVLAPGGTFAAVGYSFVIFKHYPRATAKIISLGNDDDKLGPYWDNGRLLLDNMYRDIEFKHLVDLQHHHFPNNKDGLPDILSEETTMDHFRSYIKTWSSYKTYSEKYPDRPDIVDQTIDDILKEEGLSGQDKVHLQWPTVVILGRKPFEK
ncbi:hypothetical protein BGW42_005980 [Actinomortierella wolfii]|nr:hypothetical protein BGW42_005980 [Actinomortierella wolfii]